MEQRTCSVCDVVIPPRKRRQGMCTGCYQRWIRLGKITPKPLSGLDLFWSKVNKSETCWLWTGFIGPAGYGKFGGRTHFGTTLVHRIAYIATRGPVPEGLVLDHLCRVRHCVNPDHLEPVTNRVNSMRGFGPPAMNARKTTCSCGRPYDMDRTDGRRGCRTCMTRWQADWYQRSKAGTTA